MKRLLKTAKLLAVILFPAFLAGIVLWPETLEVDPAPIDRGPLTVTIDEEGRTRVRERFVVSAPFAARVGRITLEPGDRVERNRTVVAVF
ncbi:MAG TPA: hypothetical protein VLL97_02770, partial [Acidobacteriota bacterium]|nr:hypothetical protein [Acidobacteriota bacterium]